MCLLAAFVLYDVHSVQGAQGFKLVKGEGSICAAGNGAIQFHGTGELTAKARGGQLIINDESAVISIEGKGRKYVMANGWVMYIGFHGKVRLQGEELFGQIVGKKVRMRAEGEGVMLLMGRGLFHVPCDDPNASWEFVGREGVGVDLNDYTEFDGNVEDLE